MSMMDEAEFQKFKALFVTTAVQYLDKIDSAIADGSYTGQSAVLEDLYISSHALKGQSYAMQFISLAHASKMLESVFHLMKDNKLSLDASQMSEIRILLQSMRECVKTIDATGKERDIEVAQKNFQKVFPDLDLLSL